MMTATDKNKVTGKNSDFIAEWENKKAENDAIHKKAAAFMKKVCVFAKEKVTGK
ncbi:MAG TPA: hypothetical protein PK024_12275 [Methanospirillum sp.]|uniref:hypothetical protein n=1 Tax=Methanospirillum sp. TaxID=45200 RepID=UPI002BF15EFD|nr:hypothetical protein [Methanospirillum sp.]HOJ97600.1 hypothetical protein [Methanospirillum sp.]HPP76873.1 hypothetical protein [Methanospirillum sp.]